MSIPMIRTAYRIFILLILSNAAIAQVKEQVTPKAPESVPATPRQELLDRDELQKIINDATQKASDLLKSSELQLKELNSPQFREKIRQAQLNAKIDLQDVQKKFILSSKQLDMLNKQLAAIDLGKIKTRLRDLDLNYRNNSSDLQSDYKAVEKTKTITKSYPVDQNDKLSIDNQYGQVNINTWAKNEIKVDVEIKAYESSDSRSQELLDGVSIYESKQNDLISFKTNINRNSSDGDWWGVKHNIGEDQRRGVWVNYTIYMPAKNALNITNKYGSITVPDFEGILNVTSAYGNFSGKNLSNTANRIHVSYGSANIEKLRSGNLEVKYGTLSLNNAEKLNADVSYSSAKIGKLSGDGDITLRYSGGFNVNEIDSKIKNLNVNAIYSALSLGFDPSASFNFDVTVHYAGFKYNNGKVNITSKTPSDENSKRFNPSKNYKGVYGKGSDSRIVIRSNYGSVNFL